MPGVRPHTSRNVFVVGAGFSRSISHEMPLTDELGNLCLTRQDLGAEPRVPNGGFTDGRFETWLSDLAVEQPYLSVAENTYNRALFIRFSEAIAEVLNDRVCKVLAKPLPPWVATFLKLAHITQSVIVSFNYDVLLECAVATGVVHAPSAHDPLWWTQATGDVPPWPAGASSWGAEPVETMSLLKLHGSLNWYWHPDDVAGVSVAKRVLPGTFGSPDPYDERDRRRKLPGRVPLVVPPSAAKGGYYTNPFIREMWRSAFEALKCADRVITMGYSLPTTDITFNSLLMHALRNGATELVVADLDAGGVLERLASLGLPKASPQAISANTAGPIQSFIEDWCHVVASRWSEEAHEVGALEHPVAVIWRESLVGVVVGVDSTGPDPVLVIEAPRDHREATGTREGRDALPTLSAVLRRCRPGRCVRVRVGADVQPIIDSALVHRSVGYGDGMWNFVTPAGMPP